MDARGDWSIRVVNLRSSTLFRKRTATTGNTIFSATDLKSFLNRFDKTLDVRHLPLMALAFGAVAVGAFDFELNFGTEDRRATIAIHDQKVEVTEGHVGDADISVTADSQTWLGFLAKERNLVWALLRRKIRIKGSPQLLLAFGRCFPS